MNFDDTPQEAAFRVQAKAWIAANAPKQYEDELRNSSLGRLVLSGANVLDVAKAWQKKKADAGWACLHWPREYGGRGASPIERVIWQQEEGPFGKLSGIFIIGHGMCGPTMMAYASEDHKRKYLPPLASGEKVWCQLFSEPAGGSDVAGLRTRAERDGDDWIINGRKWFTSNASIADFLIVMAVTNPDASPYRGASMFIVPVDTPGVEIVRDVGTMEHPDTVFGRYGNHGEVVYTNVRVPMSHLIGDEGDGFTLAQKRLGPGRIHHAMRWLGQAQRAFEMLCERAVSRSAHGSVLAEKQTVQNWIADSAAEITQARLLTLYAAWKMDHEGASAARPEIAMVKYSGAKVLHDVIDRAIQVHGALGFSTDMPLERMYRRARAARILDGPDEVHRMTVARSVLRDYAPRLVPSEHIPTRLARMEGKKSAAELR